MPAQRGAEQSAALKMSVPMARQPNNKGVVVTAQSHMYQSCTRRGPRPEAQATASTVSHGCSPPHNNADHHPETASTSRVPSHQYTVPPIKRPATDAPLAAAVLAAASSPKASAKTMDGHAADAHVRQRGRAQLTCQSYAHARKTITD